MTTFEPIDLDIKALGSLEVRAFLDSALPKLIGYRDKQISYYDSLRSRLTGWTQTSRKVLAILGAAAVALTAVAALARSGLITAEGSKLDVWLLAIAFLCYAIMGGITFYERTIDSTGSYFRAVGVLLSIRDLWTKFEFDCLTALLSITASDADSEKKARDQLVASARSFVEDLGKAATAEVGEWHSRYNDSWTNAASVAGKGFDELKSAVEDLAKKQEAARKTLEDATQPAFLTVKIVGDFDDDVRILVDNAERARNHLKSYPLDSIRPGYRKVEALAKRNGKDIAAAEMVECKPGLQAVTLNLA